MNINRLLNSPYLDLINYYRKFKESEKDIHNEIKLNPHDSFNNYHFLNFIQTLYFNKKELRIIDKSRQLPRVDVYNRIVNNIEQIENLILTEISYYQEKSVSCRKLNRRFPKEGFKNWPLPQQIEFLINQGFIPASYEKDRNLETLLECHNVLVQKEVDELEALLEEEAYLDSLVSK